MSRGLKPDQQESNHTITTSNPIPVTNHEGADYSIFQASGNLSSYNSFK